MKEGKPRDPLLLPRTRPVLTPVESFAPRINSTTPFRRAARLAFSLHHRRHRHPAMSFSAKGLPKGLQLDKNYRPHYRPARQTRQIRCLASRPESLGTAKRELQIICGPQIGLTPALGWNSWNCFAGAVTAEKVKAAADAMVASGLINHGWTYINIDDFWQVHRDSQDPTLQGPQRDAQGNILANPRFPDMKGLTDYVHGKGLRIGLYSSPGPWTCGGCVGSFDHEVLDARQYAAWGFDYLKYDWCSYSPELELHRGNAAEDCRVKELERLAPQSPGGSHAPLRHHA